MKKYIKPNIAVVNMAAVNIMAGSNSINNSYTPNPAKSSRLSEVYDDDDVDDDGTNVGAYDVWQ